jgi:hypothetical protein
VAKRQPKYQAQAEGFEKGRLLFLKIVWGVVIGVCVLFGCTYGYPLVEDGQVVKGILIGLVYGGGAFMAILISFSLNQKLNCRSHRSLAGTSPGKDKSCG